jgi:eukaryotic-like serine/threonine-protein kinase
MTDQRVHSGTVLGRDFRIERLLSTGGMGSVYVALQISTNTLRAVKVMRQEMLANSRMRERFEQEARIGANIPSDYVAQVLTAGVDEALGVPFLAMELLEGADLRMVVRSGGALTVTQVGLMVEQLCHAVGAAHELGIVHRDLKAENVLLTRSRAVGAAFTVKVLDFGISKLIADARTMATQAMGTPLWIAPEQTQSRSEVTPATDVWALGLLVFYTITGRIYWESAQDEDSLSLAAVMREVTVDTLATPTARAAALGVSFPAWLETWFGRCVTRDPEDRYGTARIAYKAFVEAMSGHLLTGAEAQADLAALGRRVWGLVEVAGLAVPMTPPGGVLSARRSSSLGEAVTEAAGASKAPSSTLGQAAHAAERSDPSTPSRRRANRTGLGVMVVAGILVGSGVVAGLFLPRGTGRTPQARPAAGAAVTAVIPVVAARPTSCPPDMVSVPGGTFMMGSVDGNADERPVHQVTLSSYCIDKTEVSVADYRVCVHSKNCRPADEGNFCNWGRAGMDHHPINCVDWSMAESYCTWQGRRLPTEAQWEFAARGSDGRTYPWGNEPPGPERLNSCGSECQWPNKMYPGDDGWAATAPVDSYPAGASPYGALGMAGNVREWVEDDYTEYSAAEEKDPSSRSQSSTLSTRINRGGGWFYGDPSGVRASKRERNNPSDRVMDLGFRCGRGAE